MDMSPHNMNTLFEQLGLDASPKGMKSFVENHNIPADMPLEEAPFWNQAQADFIKDSLQQDGDWSEFVDQLDAMLRK